MAPEQLHGHDADARTDIFAFGAVLHEMATGQRAFPGESTASIIAAVIERNPEPIGTIRAGLPPALDWVVGLCLEKDPANRWQSARDLVLQLERMRYAEGADPLAGRRSRRSSQVAFALAAFLVGAAAIGAWSQWHGGRQEANGADRSVTFTIRPPTGAAFAGSLSTSMPVIELAVSPDGGRVAFIARRNGQSALWIRPLTEKPARVMPGTEGARQPFWSPDGRSIGFFSGNAMKRIDAAGRTPPVHLAEATADPRGATWLVSGVIVYARQAAGPFSRSRPPAVPRPTSFIPVEG